MSGEFIVVGTNSQALFTLKAYRGEGMCLLAMNWKQGKPPEELVGFAIEYREPGGDRFYPLKNRLAFAEADGSVNPNELSTRMSPLQMFRWVHFPRNAELPGLFTYRVTPVFMDQADKLSYGEFQSAELELRRETYPGSLNVAFTRGFISSQRFVDNYGADAVPTLLPSSKKPGLPFVPTNPKSAAAYAWMGFEGWSAIREVLDRALADPDAQVRAVLYDFDQPDIVSRLERLGSRLKVIIDDSKDHLSARSDESHASARLAKSAGHANVKRQHMGALQHNKFFVVDGPKAQFAVGGSTNQSWRGYFVQNNNAVVLQGKAPVKIFRQAFDDYWDNDKVAGFARSQSADWIDLGIPGVNAAVGFSPRSSSRAVLKSIADDIGQAQSSLLFSLAFLYQTPGDILDAIREVKAADHVFSYGISDKAVQGLSSVKSTGVALTQVDGRVKVVSPAALSGSLPEPFKSEPTGGSGVRMHHKFVVIDFNTPAARVYTGSFNFSKAADTSNGENLFLIKDQRVAVSYMIEGIRIFDHYQFRLAQADAKTARKKLQLLKPPRKPGEKPWWFKNYSDARRILDRELFA